MTEQMDAAGLEFTLSHISSSGPSKGYLLAPENNASTVEGACPPLPASRRRCECYTIKPCVLSMDT
jgi:hypothetical protein